MLFCLTAVVLLVLLAAPDAALAQRSAAVFDEVEGLVSDFNDGVITVVRVLGLASIVVAAIIMIVTQKIQMRLLAASAIGLAIAAFASPIVDFLFGV